MGGPLTYNQTQENRVVRSFNENPNYFAQLEFYFDKKGGEDVLFLHLDVNEFNKTVLKEIREDLEVVMALAENYGLEAVSFIVKKEIGTKFHNMVRPIDFKKTLPDGLIVGGWFTGED